MVAQTSSQLQAVGETTSKPTYATIILPQPPGQTVTKTQLKSVEFNHGEPTIKFNMEEIAQYTLEEGLHQALILKFSYGHPDMQQVRKLIPKLFAVKGQCLIGWLARRHILIRFDKYEDYVVAASKVVNYLHCDGEDYLFRVFPWYLGFNPKEETSRAFAWVSMANLPPELFARRSLLSIASAIGKPIAIDKATQEKSRPSTARVKVEIDLLDKHPNHIRIQYLDEQTGKIMEHIQEFVFDNLPQFCSLCKHQGHEEKTCRFILVDNGDNNQLTTGNSAKIMEQYQGDARDILNTKRRASNGISKQLQTDGEDVLGNVMQQVVDENQSNSHMQEQISKGQDCNPVNNNSGKQQNGVTARTSGMDKGKDILVYKEKKNPSVPPNKHAGIRICEPNIPSSMRNVDNSKFATVQTADGNLENHFPNSEVNREQQKANAFACTSGMGNVIHGGSGTAGKKKNNEQKAKNGGSTAGEQLGLIKVTQTGVGQQVADPAAAIPTNLNAGEIQTQKPASPGNQPETEFELSPCASNQEKGIAHRGKDDEDHAIVIDDTDGQQIGQLVDFHKRNTTGGSEAAATASHFDCDHTKSGDDLDGQQIIMALDQDDETDHTDTDEDINSIYPPGNFVHRASNAKTGQQGNPIAGIIIDKQINDVTTPKENECEHADIDGHIITAGRLVNAANTSPTAQSRELNKSQAVGTPNLFTEADEMQGKISKIVESSKNKADFASTDIAETDDAMLGEAIGGQLVDIQKMETTAGPENAITSSGEELVQQTTACAHNRLYLRTTAGAAGEDTAGYDTTSDVFKARASSGGQQMHGDSGAVHTETYVVHVDQNISTIQATGKNAPELGGNNAFVADNSTAKGLLLDAGDNKIQDELHKGKNKKIKNKKGRHRHDKWSDWHPPEDFALREQPKRQAKNREYSACAIEVNYPADDGY